MLSKLQHIAQTFVKEVGNNLHNYTFVFPNRRAGIFFRKYLAQALPNPIFSPKILSINECFASLTELVVTDQLTLLLRLYQIYNQHRQNAESLEQFLYWGKMMLADFSEIDNHLIKDVKSLFALVKDMRDIDTHFNTLSEKQIAAIRSFWSEFYKSKEKKKDNGQDVMHTHFINTWQLLYPLYQDLQKNLLQDNLAYEGLLHRYVIEHWNEISEDKFCDQYVFVGFNAMTESERQLMLRLQEMGRADFYFDYHDPFLQDEHNAASRFMLNNQLLFHSRYQVIPPTREDKQQISLISVSSNVSQVHQIHEILSAQISQTTDWTQTAIVLPNEELLIPLIHAIPTEIKKINVTMGYPLRATSSYTLVAYPEQYFSPMPQNVHDFVNQMRSQLDLIQNQENNEGTYLILKELDRIEHAIKNHTNILFSVQAVQQILKMLTIDMTIPYSGEPLEGLQIMGVLETRALDFENIIITDFNDDIYPGRSRGNSFIPYTLRRGFDLPTVERQDAIFAYNFYRMLSHAKNIWFIANTHADEQHSGELSRYYYQLLWQYQVPIKHITINDKLITTIAEKEPIAKTEKVQKLLSKYFTSTPEYGRLSASALNDYVRCQKAFYYTYLENILEPEKDESISVSDATLGTVAHAIMQDLYTPLEGKIVQQSDIQTLINNINKDDYWESQTVLQKLCGDELAEHVIRSSIINTLYYDYEQAPFEFIANEMKANRTIHLPSIGQDIAITGKVDRIDIQDKHIRVIDYKTSKVDLEYSDMKKVFGLDPKKSQDEEPIIRNKGNKYILQTLLYCWLLENNNTILKEQTKHNNALLLAPHLFPMRQLHDTSTQTSVHYRQGDTIDYDRLSNDFIAELTNLLEEIFNPNIPFSPTGNKDNCENCYLAQICALKD